MKRRPSEIPDDEWIEVFRECRFARNDRGNQSVRPAVARSLGLTVASVNNYLDRKHDLRDKCNAAASIEHPGIEKLLREQGVDPEHVCGLGYAVAPDWQQGFLDLTVWPDGLHSARPVPFVAGRLLA